MFGGVLSHHKLAGTVDDALSLALEKDILSWGSKEVLMPAFHRPWAQCGAGIGQVGNFLGREVLH